MNKTTVKIDQKDRTVSKFEEEITEEEITKEEITQIINECMVDLIAYL